MNDRFREILDNLPDTTPRSRLEPYKELIQELRTRKRSYREITHVLAENCGIRVCHSTLHEFVQRYLEKDLAAPPSSELRAAEKATTQRAKSKAITRSETRERIEALKRKAASEPIQPTEFRFDESEPLRLRPGNT